MEIKNRKSTEPSYVEELAKSAVSRRKFLHFSGIFGATTIVVGSVSGISGCKKDDDDANNGVNFGSGDVGVLNYAYALEQLEAAFYTQVLSTP